MPQAREPHSTKYCGVWSPAIHEPPYQRKHKQSLTGNAYVCPRCNSSFSRRYSVYEHFPRCIRTNGNPNSLRWMDDPSCQVGNDPEGSVGVLGKKQEAALLPAVKKSRANAAMVTDIRTANIVSRWNKTGATAPAVANVLETPTAPIFSIPKEHFMLAKDPSNALFTTRNPNGVLADKKRPINVAVSPTKRRKLGRPPSIIATTSATPFALRSNKRILPSLEQPPGRRTTHNWVTAHKFSNAGELMPSVFGLDIIQERLFDKGEIFSFGPLLPYGITCPDGGMRSGTYLTDSVL